METMLFAVCDTTDVVLNSITFATAGVEDFMSTTMGVNQQDFIAKLEGYAIQGIKGIVY